MQTKQRQSFRFRVSDQDFHTSSHTGRNNSAWRCVSVAVKPEGVAVRHSRDSKKRKTTLFFTNAEWSAFVKGVKEDQFDPEGGIEQHLK